MLNTPAEKQTAHTDKAPHHPTVQQVLGTGSDEQGERTDVARWAGVKARSSWCLWNPETFPAKEGEGGPSLAAPPP